MRIFITIFYCEWDGDAAKCQGGLIHHPSPLFIRAFSSFMRFGSESEISPLNVKEAEDL